MEPDQPQVHRIHQLSVCMRKTVSWRRSVFLSGDDVLKGLKSGEYVRAEEVCQKKKGSDIWISFGKILNAVTQEYVYKTICRKCDAIFVLRKGGSTSNMRRHKCFKLHPPPSEPGEENKKEKFSSEMKCEVADKCVDFASLDLRSFEAVNGEGFKTLATTSVQTGVNLRSSH